MRTLERSIRETECVDLESLCVVAGMSVWSIACEVVVMDYDGNILDACILAAVRVHCVLKRY